MWRTLGLMLNPDTDDPLDTNLALSFFSATGDYEAAIMKHVEKYAQKSRKAYRDELQEKQQNDWPHISNKSKNKNIKYLGVKEIGRWHYELYIILFWFL